MDNTIFWIHCRSRLRIELLPLRCSLHTMISSAFLRCVARSSAPRAARAALPSNIPAPQRLRCYHTPQTTTCTPLRPSPILTRLRSVPSVRRHESTSSNVVPTTTAPDSRLERDQVPAYEMTFTCNTCTTRSSHRVSKQGYHHGTVLITCPGCKNRHLMSDHLKVPTWL
jgi:protein import protein ZIM17